MCPTRMSFFLLHAIFQILILYHVCSSNNNNSYHKEESVGISNIKIIIHKKMLNIKHLRCNNHKVSIFSPLLFNIPLLTYSRVSLRESTVYGM